MRELAIAVRKNTEPGRTLPWGVYWREPGPPPKKRSRYFATEAEATRFKTDLLAAINAAPPPDDPQTATRRGTVAEYLRSWLEVYIKPQREAATFVSYETVIRMHINPAIGALPMATLRPLVVRKFYEGLFTRGLSLARRRHVHRVLSSACGSALVDEVIDRNPCLHLGRILRHKTERHADPQPNPFSREDVTRFFAYVDTHEREWLEYFQFLHDTGVRVGEAAALLWDRVDLGRKRAEIVASYSAATRTDKTTKTNKPRWIDLTDLVVEHLIELRKRQRVETLRAGRTPRRHVFTNSRGTPRRSDASMRRVFVRVLTACGLPHHTPHDLRDTFATTHLSADYRRLPWVSRQLGHETERTTVDHYFRFLPSTVSEGFANAIR